MAGSTVTIRVRDRNPLLYLYIAKIIALRNSKKAVAFYSKRVDWKIDKLCVLETFT